jgi:hypothetical protein
MGSWHKKLSFSTEKALKGWNGMGWIERGKSFFSDQNVGYRANPIN